MFFVYYNVEDNVTDTELTITTISFTFIVYIWC